MLAKNKDIEERNAHIKGAVLVAVVVVLAEMLEEQRDRALIFCALEQRLQLRRGRRLGFEQFERVPHCQFLALRIGACDER